MTNLRMQIEKNEGNRTANNPRQCYARRHWAAGLVQLQVCIKTPSPPLGVTHVGCSPILPFSNIQ